MFQLLDFNSNMVQLKAKAKEEHKGIAIFQFQYGTIKRISTNVFSLYPIFYFNSNMVQLKESFQNFYL